MQKATRLTYLSKKLEVNHGGKNNKLFRGAEVQKFHLNLPWLLLQQDLFALSGLCNMPVQTPP